jgi:small-conductance mechanosensitive channel
MLGVVLQRALLICLLVCLPITLLWSKISGAILALGQPAAIAGGAAEYLWAVAPSLWLMAISECLKRCVPRGAWARAWVHGREAGQLARAAAGWRPVKVKPP